MKQPIEIPRNLKPGDIVVCNHGERLTVIRINDYGDLYTSQANDGCDHWRADGYSWSDIDNRWIVAIERRVSKETP